MTLAALAATRRRGVAAPLGVAAAAVAACATVAVVDPNEAGRYPLCPFRAVTGYDCPGCGTLRSVHALTRGDVLAALDLNALTVLLLPLLAWAWAGWFRYRQGRRTLPPSLPARWQFALLWAVSGFWVLRNLPLEPLSVLSSTA